MMLPRLGQRALGALIGACCAALALGPALAPGYLLFYDMVFVPHLALSGRTAGTDGSVPRAVPNDLVVSLLSQVMPGWVVQKLLLVTVFVVVGAGMGALMRSRLATVAAAVVAAWNPYVGERLAIGHWGFLLGYACLPFVAAAAGAARDGAPRGRARLALWLVAVALTGSTGSILALLVVVCVLRRQWRELAWAAGIFILVNAPWWFPFLFLAPRESGDPAGVTAFMSHADTPWGLVGSLLTGGAIWNQGVWFSSRSSWLVSGCALVIVVAVMSYAVVRRSWRGSAALTGLWIAGIISLVIAATSALPGGRSIVTAVVTDVPGGGLLRDSQKFVAVWILVVAAACGFVADRLREAAQAVGQRGAVNLALIGVAACWPLATLPDLALGNGGTWRAVQYPAAFTNAARELNAAPPGQVAIFPWTLYRRYAWDGNVVVLDPWQRLVDRSVLVNDDLPLSGQVVRGESTAAAAVSQAFDAHTDVLGTLRRLGVRYALVHTDQRVSAPTPDLAGQRLLFAQGSVRIYDLGPTAQVRSGSPRALGGAPTKYTGLGLGVLGIALAGGLHVWARRKKSPAVVLD